MGPISVQKKLKKSRKKLVMITAYDAATAGLLAEAGVDVLLVGDSVATVILGYASTRQVSLDEMIHHAKAVRRGAPQAFILGDMPFVAVKGSAAAAVAAARRFTREAGCNAVKMEWNARCLEHIRAVREAGIAVMGHLGLTPQSVTNGRFRVQATRARDAALLLERALALQEAGVYSVLLECVPAEVAETVTRTLRVPTVGIGAGVSCGGQVLVFQDVVGVFEKFKPKFVKRYAHVAELERRAVQAFARDVREGRFPGPSQSFHMSSGERLLWRQYQGARRG